MFRRRAPMFVSRSLMFASRSLTHGSSRCDAHLAHVETQFAAARRPIRHS
jgi:hypothetical protein